ncbi:MAG: DUF1592 domain-containing protein [Deltaproteobacteria bacterium]|nr:DUF1592 domain-containing protein [Deltaproteobacteria bacterium]
MKFCSFHHGVRRVFPVKAAPLFQTLLMLCLTAVAAVGCQGSVTGVAGLDNTQSGGSGGQDKGQPEGGQGGEPNGSNASFSCNEDIASTSEPLFKLTNVQYANEIRDLVTLAIQDSAIASQVQSELTKVLSTLPVDDRPVTQDDAHGSYRRLDNTVQQNEADAHYAVALAVGKQLTASGRVAAMLAPCVPTASDNCVATLIDRLAPRVLGRPLASSERSFYMGIAGTGTLDTMALGDMLTVLFMAPSMVFRIEHGSDTKLPDGRIRLTDYELARRLALHLWQTIPDDELWRAAEDGALSKDQGYAAQVDRMLHDPRARQASQEFIREWLKLDHYPAFQDLAQKPRYVAFARGALPSAGLRDAITREAVDMVDHYLWSSDGHLADVLTSKLAFPRSVELAKLYDLPVWDGQADPPEFSDPDRTGLLTRAAMLATLTPKTVAHDASTHPIIKGFFIQKYLLCRDFPPPPANAGTQNLDELKPDMSSRRKAEVQTESSPNCRSCHAFMNPLGYVTEMFDSLGRKRAEEVVFDDQGKELARRPINTLTTPSLIDGDKRTVSTPAELVEMIERTGEAEACLARNYFRYTMSRVEDLDADGCSLGRLNKALTDSGGGLRAMVRQMVTDSMFKTRSFQ